MKVISVIGRGVFFIKRCRTIIILSVMMSMTDSVLLAQDDSYQYSFLHSGSYVRDKNFYLLTLFEKRTGVDNVLQQDKLLAALKEKKINLLLDAIASCHNNAECHSNVFMWTEEEITAVGERLKFLGEKNTLIKDMIKYDMRPSGFFQRYATFTDADMLATAWRDAATSMNRIIEVYANGKKPMYPLIDSPSYDVRSLIYRENINIVSHVMQEFKDELKFFYDPALSFSLQLLDINMRDEAARFEPLAEQNQRCLDFLREVLWEKYPYNAIMVPGAGPDIATASIDPWAKSRLKIAVNRFKGGVAPIIIVSGGFVKPFQTQFCEGLEMKKYLVTEFGIPEKCILLEPYARHTTTNLRNTFRLIFQHGLPVTKPTLVISDMYQTKTMQSEKFKERCVKELGYLPFIECKTLGKFETEFTASILSLHRNSMDPLDP